MSWQIPTQIEQDIIAGKATYRTFQTGNGGQSILPVPANSYVVIFGYDFSPAGGGWKRLTATSGVQGNVLNDSLIRWFETQQISFYTGTDFYPFIHHVNINSVPYAAILNTANPEVTEVTSIRFLEEIDNTPIARQLYITSSNDITITHGLILNSGVASANAIPVTNRTPVGLTFGGSGIVNNTQTDYGPAGTPLQFMQPSPKDYQDFGFGLLPNNADAQAFATPSNLNGLTSAYNRLLALAAGVESTSAAQYYLCLHYALYSKTIPETRG